MGNSIQRPIARFEDFEVRLETGEVWKAGRLIKVQDQPFKVLAALLERPGQIVTREELRQLIWPEKASGISTTPSIRLWQSYEPPWATQRMCPI